jgi:hypothetical protein
LSALLIFGIGPATEATEWSGAGPFLNQIRVAGLIARNFSAVAPFAPQPNGIP